MKRDPVHGASLVQCNRKPEVCCFQQIPDLRIVKCGPPSSLREKVREAFAFDRNRIGLTTATSPLIFLKFSAQKVNMAKDNEVQMPSSQGGLVQYFDADSGFEIDPKTVVAFSAGVAILEIALHMGL